MSLIGPAQNLQPRYNLAPSQLAAVVRTDKDGQRVLSMMRFGLIPAWAEDVTAGYKMINARCETVTRKAAFNLAFRHRRCLIPADGFYEWKNEIHGKQPYRIIPDDEPIFGLGGLWERWKVPDDLTLKGEFTGYKPGDWIESFTIITTPPNEAVAPLHNRMPLIIKPKDFETWLTGEASAKHEDLLRTYHGPLRVYPVSTRVNKPENDDAACIEPLGNQQ